MDRKALTYMLLSLVLAVYLGASLFFSNKVAAGEVAGPMRVNIVSGEAHAYITAEDILADLKAHKADTARLLRDVDLEAIERYLETFDNIEHVTAYHTYHGKTSRVAVDVKPMVPVARIFADGKSFYINRSGKRLTASHRFHVDVPVIMTHNCDSAVTGKIMPLIDYLNVDRDFASFITAVELDRNDDIILYPMTAGHVINFGDATMIKDKIHRLMRIYQDVLKVKGWNYYDTLSVKWRGQVVATRRMKDRPVPADLFDADEETQTDLGYLDTIPDPNNHI